MNEQGYNWYHRCNHGYYADPESADTKDASFDSHFYLLLLARRSLVIQRVPSFRLTAFRWLDFSVFERGEPVLPAMWTASVDPYG